MNASATAPAPAAGPTCAAEYFDGRQARGQPVRLGLWGDELRIDGEGVALRLARREVRWPERQRHGPRQAFLPDGGLLQSLDPVAWDDWARRSGLQDSGVVRAMQSWQLVLGAAVAMLALLVALWRWGLPAAADLAVGLMPVTVDEHLGEAALASLDGALFKPSTLAPERERALQAQFAQALRARPSRRPGSTPDSPAPPPDPAWTLALRDGRASGLGPNAIALPGGRIIVTDQLAALLADRPEVMLGVLGHEYGHLRHRHGTRMLVRGTLLGGLVTLVSGDMSAVIAAVPLALGQAAYSREFEFEADDEAARLLRDNGHSPQVMAVLFERLRATGGGESGPDHARGGASQPAAPEPSLLGRLPMAFSSHPPDAERVARMVRVARAGD